MIRQSLLLFLILLNPVSSDAKQLPDILPLDQVQPGQTGYGLTVFSGFKIERFKVEVIDIVHKFLPKQDIILIRVDHPILRKTGVVGGMSGSPIFLQDKLVGAVAYGWSFTKEPVCGVTPIQDMLDLMKVEVRGADHAGYAASEKSRQLSPQTTMSAMSRRDHLWQSHPLRQNKIPVGDLAPVTVPLNAAGFSPEELEILKDAFSSYGFEPVLGGGIGRTDGPNNFVPGSAIGIQLVSGDMSMIGTGTVTWVGPKQLIAFGHPMFNAGELHLPTTTARINHTLSSLARSHKISSPSREIGSLIQDRQAGIVVDISERASTIPMVFTIHQGNKEQVFRVQLARHRLLTPSLATAVASAALSQAIPDVARSTFTTTTRLDVRGYPQMEITEQQYSGTGTKIVGAVFSRGLQTIEKILDNEFGPAHIDRIEINMHVTYAKEVVEIKSIRMNTSEVKPGSLMDLTVSFRPFDGPEFTKVYPLEIPPSMDDSVLVVEVAGGASVPPEIAPPKTFEQYLKNLQAGYPANSLVISLSTPTQGLKMQGQVIQALPPSVIDSLNTGAKTEFQKVFHTFWRNVFETQRLVIGKSEIRLRVQNDLER
ncbi:MAG: SpoIVB peptidase S55 domain-containing protein [Pseudomonadota bacterium]